MQSNIHFPPTVMPGCHVDSKLFSEQHECLDPFHYSCGQEHRKYTYVCIVYREIFHVCSGAACPGFCNGRYICIRNVYATPATNFTLLCSNLLSTETFHTSISAAGYKWTNLHRWGDDMPSALRCLPSLRERHSLCNTSFLQVSETSAPQSNPGESQSY